MSAPALIFGWLAGWRHWAFVVLFTIIPLIIADLWMQFASAGHPELAFCYGIDLSSSNHQFAILVLVLPITMLLFGLIARLVLLYKHSFWFVLPPQDPKRLRRYLMGIYLSHASFFLILLGAVALFVYSVNL
jgi:hypothetical protein